jgi:hypothetical protein
VNEIVDEPAGSQIPLEQLLPPCGAGISNGTSESCSLRRMLQTPQTELVPKPRYLLLGRTTQAMLDTKLQRLRTGDPKSAKTWDYGDTLLGVRAHFNFFYIFSLRQLTALITPFSGSGIARMARDRRRGDPAIPIAERK